MAVSEQTPYIEYTANGSVRNFALGFDCENQDHLIVLVDEIEPVVGTWSLISGAVVFGVAPVGGKKITIQRNTPFRRDEDFQSYDNSFRPPGVNKGFDRVWYKIQELGVRDWLLDLKIQKFRDEVNLTALENTLKQSRDIRDATSLLADEVQANTTQSATLLTNTTAKANAAATSATNANTAKTQAQQVVTDANSIKTDMYTALYSFQNGATKAYPTLAAATADIANIALDTKVSVLSATDGGDYYKATAGATSLTKSPYDAVLQAKSYVNAETKPKANLAYNMANAITVKTANLFDKKSAVKGFYGDIGVDFEASTQYWCSDFIPVEAGKMYKRANGTDTLNVYAYDANFQPVIVNTVNGNYRYWKTQFETTPIPATVKYIRALFLPSLLDTFMIAESTADTSSYVPYRAIDLAAHPQRIETEVGSASKVATAKTEAIAASKSYTDTKTQVAISAVDSITVKTINLFDKKSAVKGYYGNLGSTFEASTQYWCSDFIPVEAGKMYKRANGTNTLFVYAYDANFQPVIVNTVNGNYRYWQAQFETTPIPATVKYIRVLFLPTLLDLFMLAESTADTSNYAPFRKIDPTLFPTSSGVISPGIFKNCQGIHELGMVDNQLFNTDYSHIIFYGQSLSMGWESAEALTTDAVDKTWMMGDRVWINQGNDESLTLNPLVATKGTNSGESPTVAATHCFRLMLDKYLPGNNVDLIGTGCGVGGQPIERLSKGATNGGGSYYDYAFMLAVNRAKTIANANSKSISCPAIVWMQGENNYTGLTGTGYTPGSDATNDKATYKTLLKKLKDDMQADIMATYGQSKKPLFFMYQVGGAYITLDTMSINMAMLELAAENPDMILMNPTYQVPDYSGGHLSSNGYRWYGEYIAKQMTQSLLKHQNSVTVQAKEIELLEQNKQIAIHCSVPKAPLVFDSYTAPLANYSGFKVADDTGEIVIESVSIVSGTTVLLKLARALSTNAYVTYAGKDRNGTGNIRDSEVWTSKYSYTDETSYTKKPTYTPKDVSGSTLYGKKYPMHNWLIAFYQKLT